SEETIEKIFRNIDKDGNGKIHPRELQYFFKKHQLNMTINEVKQYMKRFDVNGDGLISLEELKQAFGKKS
ncbi:Calcium-binding protein, partial [Fasciola gigantica]